MGLYGPKIVWVMYGFFSKQFWRTKLDQVDCTEEQMNEVVEGLFLIKHANNNEDEITGIANITCTILLYWYLYTLFYKNDVT